MKMDNDAFAYKNYDNWKTRLPYEPPEIEIRVVDLKQVQEAFLMVDEDAVLQAWHGGQRDFPGIDVYELP